MGAPIIWGAGTPNLDWYAILPSLGIDVPHSPRRHGPCPICGGKDRFRFDNRNGSGSWYCNQGGANHRSGKTAGDGVALVADFFDVPVRDAWEKIRGISGESTGGQILRDKCAAPVPPVDPSNQRKVQRLIKDSVRLGDVTSKSRIILQDGKTAVEKYLASRGLPLLLPEEARINVQQDGYDLIIPLTSDGDIPSLHITSLDKAGQKRHLSWTGGSCRYTMGPLSGAYASVPGAEEQISVPSFPGIRFYSIAEGLESAISGRLLSGWSSIFAVNAHGIKSFLDCQETLAIFQSSGFGLAILVDRDKSGTGQKASAALAHKAQALGIPVLYLLPPSIAKGSKKSADWNDVLSELGLEGAKAALALAISMSEAALETASGGKALQIDKIRETADPGTPLVDRVSLAEGGTGVRGSIRDRLTTDKSELIAVDAGIGKSKIVGDLSWDHQIAGAPLLTITPTRALAEEASTKGGGLFREGRTDDQTRAGHCPIYPDVEPYSQRWRSVVAHKCHDCPHGIAAMAVLRDETPEGMACPHLLHIHDSRISPVVTSTAAMLEGDPSLGTHRRGAAAIPRKVILDDTCDLSDHRTIHGGHVSEWIRAAHCAIRIDRQKIASGSPVDGENSRQERIKATEALIPHLAALARLLSQNPGEEQIRLVPESWEGFIHCVQSSKLGWMDGLAAELVYRDREGILEIPLRTLKALGEALGRGTAWVCKSVLHFAVPTKAFKAIQNGALVLDATPSMALRQIIEAGEGKITEIRVQQPSLVVRQVVSGSHGKTSCLPDSPSFERERDRLLGEVEKAVATHGASNVALLTHKSFVEAISATIPAGVSAGWWGLHGRGHNDWEHKKHLIIWGVPQLSPSVAEREYMADRQAVIEAGGAAWEDWNGAREEKWYGIPAQAKEIHASGYRDEFVDRWAREWTTAEVVQAIGRLRAVRRHDEALSVDIHSTFPFAAAFGMEIHEVPRAPWRTMGDYQSGRKTEQIERGVIAFLATNNAGRRPANDWLEQHEMKGTSPNDWREIRSRAGGIRREYALFPSNTTPDLFGKDVHLLIAALDRLAAYAEAEGLTLEDIARDGVIDPNYAERCALLVLRTSIFGGPDHRSRKKENSGRWWLNKQKRK